LVPGGPESEAGEMPSTELLGEMTKYNEELVKSGVMLAGEGLHPTSRGAKIRFSGSERTVIDGPFTEAKEIVAGYWIWSATRVRRQSSGSSERRSAAASRSSYARSSRRATSASS
jgi:hypothetical protein